MRSDLLFTQQRKNYEISGESQYETAKSIHYITNIIPTCVPTIKDVSPFRSSRYQYALSTDKDLQKKLSEAINTYLPHQRDIPFMIIQMATHKFAGNNIQDIYFSGSLLKVAAMYASEELLYAAKELAKSPSGPKTGNDLFRAMECGWTPIILDKFKSILQQAGSKVANSGVGQSHSVPQYREILRATPNSAGLDIDFTPNYRESLRSMIADGTNSGACQSIRRLGYGYLISVLESAGFLNVNAATVNGIWAGGDFSKSTECGVIWPYLEVNSMNDGWVGLATNVRQMGDLSRYSMNIDL